MQIPKWSWSWLSCHTRRVSIFPNEKASNQWYFVVRTDLYLSTYPVRKYRSVRTDDKGPICLF